MKSVFVFAPALLALALSASAQVATPKPERKTLTFEPYATTPNPVKATPAKAAATPKATPKPEAKPDAKSAAATAAAAKAAALAAEQPADAAPPPASPAVVTSTVPPEPAQIVRAFYGLLQKGDIDGAYANLMKGSRIGERPDEVKTLKAKTKDAIDIFGAIHGYDLVDIKPVGERLIRATYLSLGHELPLRWRFYFYKAETIWKLIDIRVDDKLTGIFDEATEEVPRNSDTRP